MAVTQTELTPRAGSTPLMEVSSTAPSAAPYTVPDPPVKADAADDHGAHHDEFVPVAGVGVDVAEPGEVQGAGESGERPADDGRPS